MTEPLSRAPERTSKCKSCGARIVWAHTLDQKAMPVDAEPTPTGNVLLSVTTGDPDEQPLYTADVMTGPRLDLARKRGQRLFTSHFATCPDATSWRHRDDA